MPQQIVNLSTQAPGFFGLNRQAAGDILPVGWATEAVNFVFDDIGRLAARKGTQYVNTSAISGTPTVKTVFEYIDSVGNSTTILAAGNKIYSDLSGTLTDITGSITCTADHWQFVNFNGNVVGFQASHRPIIWKGTSTFTYLVDEHTARANTTAYSTGDMVIPVTSSSFYLKCKTGGTTAGSEPGFATTEGIDTTDGTVVWTTHVIPDGDAGCAAGGLLWNIDGQLLKYSDLLIPHVWDTTNTGNQFDLGTVWRNGMDAGVAISEFNGYLAVFGKHSIAVYSGYWNQQTAGAVDVTSMSLVENIAGTGCLGRDTVADIGEDILFMSRTGVRSLGRTIQEKSNPLTDISKNVRDYLLQNVLNESSTNLKATFHPRYGFYILSIPFQSKVFCFDTKQPLQDGALRCTEWNVAYHALSSHSDNELYIGMTGGYFSKYAKYADGISSTGTGGSTYTVLYHSAWHDFGEEVSDRLKIPKRMGITCYGGNSQTFTLKWAYDYSGTFQTQAVNIPDATVAEYGIAEYNIAEWSGGIEFNTVNSSITQSGRIIMQGITGAIDGRSFALQRINTQAKLGRMVL